MQFLFFTVLVLLLAQNGQSQMVATANIHVDSTSIGIGTIIFHQRDGDSPVEIFGIIDSLRANTVHGFHVHAEPLGDHQYNCTAAGPHFNPYNVSHGPPSADRQNRHVGDLGNVTANDNGIIIIETRDQIISLHDPQRSIAHRTIVLHAMRDDGGTGGFPDSKTTGNAGPRIACGVISEATRDSSTYSRLTKNPTKISSFFKQIFP